MNDEIRALLIDEKGRLERARSAFRRERPGDVREADTQDVNEAGAEIAEQNEERLLLESVNADLVEVEAALARLLANDYGHCEKCGKPIAEDRLLALPTTRVCVACGDSR